MRVAALCMRSGPGAIKENLAKMEALSCRAAAEGAEIVCFPEFSVTGYVLRNPQGVYAETSYESVLDRIMSIAGKHGIVLLAGLIEPFVDGPPAIGQLVAGPEGIMGIHRKTHLSPPEKQSFRPGNRVSVFHCKDKVFGVQLCYESHFPEISTMMALKGADILFMPHASPRGTPEEKLESWLRHLTGRAFDNALFIAACNSVGESQGGFPFPGVILFLGPDGRMLNKHLGNDEHLLTTTLDFSLLDEIRGHRMKYFLPCRRPDIYGPLSES